MNSEDGNLLLNFIWDLGYFTNLENKYRKDYEEVYSLTIPNREIRKEIRRSLHKLSFLKDKFRVFDSNINSYIQSIINLGYLKSTYEEFGKAVLKLFATKVYPKMKDSFIRSFSCFRLVLRRKIYSSWELS